MKIAASFVGVALALLGSATAKNMGPLDVAGSDQQVYLVAPDWAVGNIEMHGSSGFTLRGGGRVYFAVKPVDDFGDPNMYWQTNLDAKHFSYTLDLSNVGCHCNAAGYFIDMPGPAAGQGGDWYCDANFVNNQWCPEYDTLESNRHTVAGTLHTCNGGDGYWSDCDRGGCQNNAFFVDSNMFCPEARCKINTQQPFLVSHYQDGTQANIWMQQGSNEASFNFCQDGGYCSKMAQSYGGMVFGASLWGGGGINMDWLDGMTGCWGECDLGSSSVTFTGFNVW